MISELHGDKQCTHASRQDARLELDALETLPLGSILPKGWLHTQLDTQARGLTGSLDEFWPDVANSAWIGGDGDGWERGPYWLDGVVPLAFLLEDDALRAKADRWIQAILQNQMDDGWLGPIGASGPDSGWSGARYPQYDTWPRTVVVKALIQYFEATQHPDIIPALTRFYRKVEELIRDGAVLREWARFRWPDFLLGVHWLYRQMEETWLIDLARDIQALGFDWNHHFHHFPYTSRVSPIECDLSSHGPNHAMAVKYGAVSYRQSHDPRDLNLGTHAINVLDRFHGQANGMFSCDEHLAGRHPSQGTELCAVVEAMYSLEVATAISGDLTYADLLERLAFNALPATISADMWTHQYLQQVNQIRCVVTDYPVYTSNRGDANTFGLEPHFGCCTANMHQGWPKFATHLWMKTRDGDLAAISYAPCQVKTDLDGHTVSVLVSGDYPFSDHFSIDVENTDQHPFDLQLRIPSWCDAPIIVANDTVVIETGAAGMVRVPISEARTTITVTFPQRPRFERRSDSSVAVYIGPLLMALPLAETWTPYVERPEVNDYMVTTDSNWSYALAIDSITDWQVEHAPLADGELAFADSPTVICHARGLAIDWAEDQDVAVFPPKVSVDSVDTQQPLRLVPYGAARLRIAEFPFVEDMTDEVKP